VAEFPRQIRKARPLLERLATTAPAALAEKPVELVWGMKDRAFGREQIIRRWLSDFPNASVTRLADASHYVQEDAPEALASAVERVVGRTGPIGDQQAIGRRAARESPTKAT
jgi:haloalkane dehalogenase